MPIDPKIRTGAPPVRLQPTTTPSPIVKPAVAPLPVAQPKGYGASSTFDPAGYSTVKRDGVPDDSVGRRTTAGVVDDGVGRRLANGVVDDGVGRKLAGGVVDDGVGRTAKKGVIDDGVGQAALDALVGLHDTPATLAARNALFQKLEAPTFLQGTATVPAQVAAYARTMGLSSTQLGQVDGLLKGASPEAATLVGALLQKSPDVLSNADSKGQTTLANLARLAQQPLNAMVAGDTTTDEVLTSVLRDIVNPNRIDQGDAPTCTVTSMQYELVDDHPSEYARIMADLSGPDGRSKMMGGADLLLKSGDAGAGARDSRSVGDALFQTTAMEYGNGRDETFDPYAGKSVNPTTGAEQRGLKPAQQTQVLRQLFGINYVSKNFMSEAEGAKALEKLQGFDASKNQNRPIILQIDQGAFNHAVSLEKVADGRVSFRDPYGVLRSMSEAQFPKFVMAINAPRDMNIV